MFKGLGNLGNLASMVGKLQDVPKRMQELNDQMKSERVSASSACGHVSVTMNGIGEVQQVDIAEDVVDGSVPAEKVAHAVRDATNAAGAAAKQLYADSISQLAKEMDLNVPGIDGLLSNLSGKP